MISMFTEYPVSLMFICLDLRKKNGFISADDLDKLYEDLGIEVDKDEIDEIIENLETGFYFDNYSGVLIILI